MCYLLYFDCYCIYEINKCMLAWLTHVGGFIDSGDVRVYRKLKLADNGLALHSCSKLFPAWVPSPLPARAGQGAPRRAWRSSLRKRNYSGHGDTGSTSWCHIKGTGLRTSEPARFTCQSVASWLAPCPSVGGLTNIGVDVTRLAGSLHTLSLRSK